MAAARPTSKVAAFLASYTGPATRPCKLCSHKEASAALNEIIAARKAGKTDVSLAAVARWITAEFKLPIAPTFLQYCCSTHRGGSWNAHSRAKAAAK